MRFPLPCLLVALLCMPSCGADTEATGAEAGSSLAGRWNLVSARRDNVRTDLLDKLYFEFSDDGSFRTNLLTNEDQEGRYELDDGTIMTSGVEVPLEYEIRDLSTDELWLRARYQGYLFDFELSRSAEEEVL